MPFILSLDGSGNVVGYKLVKDGYVPDASEAEVSQADFETVAGTPIVRGPGNGPYRWQWDGGALVEQPETRARLVVSMTDGAGNPKTVIDGDGVDSVQIDFEVRSQAGSLLTGITGRRELIVDVNGTERPYRINVSGGVASVTFATTEMGRYRIPATDQYIPEGDTFLQVIRDL